MQSLNLQISAAEAVMTVEWRGHPDGHLDSANPFEQGITPAWTPETPCRSQRRQIVVSVTLSFFKQAALIKVLDELSDTSLSPSYTWS